MDLVQHCVSLHVCWPAESIVITVILPGDGGMEVDRYIGGERRKKTFVVWYVLVSYQRTDVRMNAANAAI